MREYYAAIFGAGIAGTAIAAALIEKGKNVLLIDPYVSEEAPGAPAALVNPAAGKRAKMSWEAPECMRALLQRFQKIEISSGRNDLMARTGVIRPALTEELAENFRDSLSKYDWPDDWIKWIDKNEVEDLNPDLAPSYGGLFLDCGFTVYVDKYLNEYRKYLRKSGADCRYEHAEYQADAEGSFQIKFKNGDKAAAGHVIVAAGHQTPFFEDWKYLNLHRVKGQIVQFETEKELKWNHAVSSLGYILRLGKNELVAGSTYEHHFDDLDITDDAYNRIFKKLKDTLPEIAVNATKINQMAGVRVTAPNKLPVIGRHKKMRNLCIYSAMGSKGLLFSEYVSSLLVNHLTNGEPIPEELDTARLI